LESSQLTIMNTYFSPPAAETGEVLTVEHVPEQCSVKGLAQLLDNKHNLRADETTLLFNGEFRLENALVFDASKVPSTT